GACVERHRRDRRRRRAEPAVLHGAARRGEQARRHAVDDRQGDRAGRSGSAARHGHCHARRQGAAEASARRVEAGAEGLVHQAGDRSDPPVDRLLMATALNPSPAAAPEPVAFVNGAWLPVSQASVSILDRGFLFADGVYEVVPVYAGRGFQLREHLQRLARSLKEIRIPDPHTEAEWTALVEELIARNRALAADGNLMVYLQVTRGVGER